MRYELKRLERVMSAARLNYHPNHNIRYLALNDAVRAKGISNLLVLGCGWGVVEYLLWNVHSCSLDLNPERIEGARDLNARHDARFEVGSLYEAGSVFPSRQFDAVVISEVIEHLEDDRGAIAAAAKMLKPSGWFFLTVPNRRRFTNRLASWRGRPPALLTSGHLREYDLSMARDALASGGFKVQGLRGVYWNYPARLDRLVSPYHWSRRFLAWLFPASAVYLLFIARKATDAVTA